MRSVFLFEEGGHNDAKRCPASHSIETPSGVITQGFSRNHLFLTSCLPDQANRKAKGKQNAEFKLWSHRRPEPVSSINGLKAFAHHSVEGYV